MKKNILLFTSLTLLLNNSFAQPIIDSVNFTPINQESFVINNCNYAHTNILTGANITWNFSGLITSLIDTIQYVVPDDTGYSVNNCYQYNCLNVPQSSFAIPNYPNQNGALMFEYTNYGKIDRGFCNEVDNWQCSWTNQFPFPLTYNDSSLAIYYGNGQHQSGPYYSWVDTVNYALHAEGYGTIILPNTTYNNALMITVIRQTKYVDDLFGTTIYHDTIYYWLVPDIHNPVLEIQFPNAHYLSQILLTAGENVKGNLFIVSPNPATSNSEITFTYSSLGSPSEIVINNIDGKEVGRYHLPQGSSAQKIKLPEMAKGVYVARLISNFQIPISNIKFVIN